jgi:hypothetical protein
MQLLKNLQTFYGIWKFITMFTRIQSVEELLGRKSSGSGLESQEYGRRDLLRWPQDTLYPQKLALTLATSGGRSVGIVSPRVNYIDQALWPFQWICCVNNKMFLLLPVFSSKRGVLNPLSDLNLEGVMLIQEKCDTWPTGSHACTVAQTHPHYWELLSIELFKGQW